MPDIQHLEYALEENGYIHNWLLAGPQSIPVSDLASFAGQGDELRANVARHYHRDLYDLYEPPLEWATFQVDGADLVWHYARCREDHLIDLSSTYATCCYLRSWAYADLIVPSATAVEFVLTANGLADVWVNRQHVYGNGQEHGQDPARESFQVELVEGRNEVLVRFEVTAIRACPYVMALQVTGISPQDVTVRLPVQHTNLYRRHKLERVFDQAHIEHLISVRGQGIAFRWDDELEMEDDVEYWLRSDQGIIVISGAIRTQPGEQIRVGQRLLTLDGEGYNIVFVPPGHVVQRYDIRYRKFLPIYVLEHAYSDAYYGTAAERRQEALDYAAGREGIYAEIARLALERQSLVDGDVIQDAVMTIDQRQDNSVFDLVGLLGVMYRYPRALALSQERAQDCVLGFKYWHDEPGSDVMCYTSESHSILFHTCEILAGQLYPDQVFTNAGQTGQWHCDKGEKLALDWLRKRGAKGFAEWDANDGFEKVLLALSHLADLAQDDEIRELAAIVMDKILFTIAVNSYKGVFGSTHGRTSTLMVKSGQLEATSGITRLMWGMGVWNYHIKGLVALACSNYELPTMIASIAVDLEQEMWHKEHHPSVDKVTYRTPDTMLCSAQDYHPGEKGCGEHIWQATLGPDAVVFVNHPSCASENDAQQANFWRGNGILPRVAQWKDVLIALYEGDTERGYEAGGLGFTHAHFPTHEFDESVVADGWAFAQKGNGYLALAAAQGFDMIMRGTTALRELRSDGEGGNAWLCMMGRAETDGTFEAFQAKVKALAVEWQEQGVRCETLRGETLSFDWQGSLLVDGEAQPLSGFKHYDGPHCVAEWPASQMDIHYGDYAVRLVFD